MPHILPVSNENLHVSLVFDMNDPDQKVKSEKFLINYIRISSSEIEEEEIIQLISEKPDLGLILNQEKWNSKLSLQSLHQIFDNLHDNKKIMYNGILQKILFCENIDVSLMEKIYTNYNDKHVVIPALLRRPELPQHFLREILEEQPDQKLSIAMHPNLDDETSEKLWFELENKRDLLAMAPKAPLHHALSHIIDNKNIEWEVFKNIHETRPEWATELRKKLQPYMNDSHVDTMPVEWLENLFITLIIE